MNLSTENDSTRHFSRHNRIQHFFSSKFLEADDLNKQEEKQK